MCRGLGREGAIRVRVLGVGGMGKAELTYLRETDDVQHCGGGLCLQDGGGCRLSGAQALR